MRVRILLVCGSWGLALVLALVCVAQYWLIIRYPEIVLWLACVSWGLALATGVVLRISRVRRRKQPIPRATARMRN